MMLLEWRRLLEDDSWEFVVSQETFSFMVQVLRPLSDKQFNIILSLWE